MVDHHNDPADVVIRSLVGQLARSSNSESTLGTHEPAMDFQTILDATRQIFGSKRQNGDGSDSGPPKRGRKRNHQWKVNTFLLRCSSADFHPSPVESAFLCQHGFGKSRTGRMSVNRNMTLAELGSLILAQYPEIPLASVGFSLGKCDKGRTMYKIEPCSVQALEDELGRGTLFIIPNRDLPFIDNSHINGENARVQPVSTINGTTHVECLDLAIKQEGRESTNTKNCVRVLTLGESRSDGFMTVTPVTHFRLKELADSEQSTSSRIPAVHVADDQEERTLLPNRQPPVSPHHDSLSDNESFPIIDIKHEQLSPAHCSSTQDYESSDNGQGSSRMTVPPCRGGLQWPRTAEASNEKATELLSAYSSIESALSRLAAAKEEELVERRLAREADEIFRTRLLNILEAGLLKRNGPNDS